MIKRQIEEKENLMSGLSVFELAGYYVAVNDSCNRDYCHLTRR